MEKSPKQMALHLERVILRMKRFRLQVGIGGLLCWIATIVECFIDNITWYEYILMPISAGLLTYVFLEISLLISKSKMLVIRINKQIN